MFYFTSLQQPLNPDSERRYQLFQQEWDELLDMIPTPQFSPTHSFPWDWEEGEFNQNNDLEREDQPFEFDSKWDELLDMNSTPPSSPHRSYSWVWQGGESNDMNFDSEVTDLLSELFQVPAESYSPLLLRPLPREHHPQHTSQQ